jgi:antitoxin CptB
VINPKKPTGAAKRPPAYRHLQEAPGAMNREDRLKRLRFRAWHRGTKEADLLIGCYFDSFSAGWSDAEIDWIETLLDEQDADIVAWAIGAEPVPERYAGPMMERMQAADYIDVTK